MNTKQMPFLFSPLLSRYNKTLVNRNPANGLSNNWIFFCIPHLGERGKWQPKNVT